MKRRITPYQGTQLELLPGDSITTHSGTATVVRTAQAGLKTIIFADYGSGVEQPHIPEGIRHFSRLQDGPLEQETVPGRGWRAIAPCIREQDSASRPTPLEQEVDVLGDQAEAAHDAIALLEQERDCLKAEGAIAPDGCWIETGKVQGRNFRQAWWRSTRPIFPAKRARGELVKSCYIGAEGSPEHQGAIAARERRDQLKRIARQIQFLMEELEQ